MFKKEDSIKYFIGGTAVGMAAGVLMSKLFIPNISGKEDEISRPGASITANVVKCTQDDNIYSSLYFRKNAQCCHIRSKSASRYENLDYKEHSMVTSPLKKLPHHIQDSINDLASKPKSKGHLSATSHFNKIPLCNISKENNISYVLNERGTNAFSKEHSVDLQNEKISNSCHLSKITLNGTNNENINIANKINVLKHSKVSKHMSFPEVVNNFSPDDNTSVHSETATNLAICGTVLNLDDVEENRILRFCSLDEFEEGDIISSTKTE